MAVAMATPKKLTPERQEKEVTMVPVMVSAEEQARKMLKRADNAKAQMYDVPGKQPELILPKENVQGTSDNVFTIGDMFHSVIVDKKFTLVRAHVDGSLRKRIKDGEFFLILPDFY